MPLENIPRIEAPSAEELLRSYILPRRPVIITNLFDGAPIRAIDRLEEARRELADVPVEVHPNYLVFLSGQRAERRRMRLADYLDHVAADPKTKDVCAELETPPELSRLFPRTPYCDLRDPSDMVSATFVANGGNFAHLHVDLDQRDVLMYQVFGDKRFSLVAPEHARRLDSFVLFDPATRSGLSNVPAYEGNGRAFLHELPSPEVLDQFLRYLHASDAVVHAGETIYMPALYWHYIEYRDTSLSITHRLGRNRYNRKLARLFPYPSTFVQAVGSALGDPERLRAEHPEVMADLEAALFADAPNDDAKAAAVDAAVLRAYERLTGDSPQAVAVAREVFRRSALVF